MEAATKFIPPRSKEFEDAVKVGDSIAVGDIYTQDTKIIGAYSGRENIVKEVYEMKRDSITGIKFRIVNLWGNENIIIEDAYVEFFHSDGTLLSKGECLLVWKKENDKWRIFEMSLNQKNKTRSQSGTIEISTLFPSPGTTKSG